ncbi:hypothetical protein AAVH_37023, partial [Aphelenchoides avenae]
PPRCAARLRCSCSEWSRFTPVAMAAERATGKAATTRAALVVMTAAATPRAEDTALTAGTAASPTAARATEARADMVRIPTTMATKTPAMMADTTVATK